jgi:GTP-binding protein EngB required for normal cell division
MSEYAKALLQYLRERRRCMLQIADHDDDGNAEQLHREMVELASGEVHQRVRTIAILNKFDEMWAKKWASTQSMETLLERYPEAF